MKFFSLTLLLSIFILAISLCPKTAQAAFDIVGVYQDKLREFEAVYYLEEDESWHRERLVWEVFIGPELFYSETSKKDASYTDGTWGFLYNKRPKKDSRVQLSLFNISSSSHRDSTDSSDYEALHGGRLSFGDWAEISMGGYFANGTSLFMELNSTKYFFKSSWIIGKGFSDQASVLRRFDLRFTYDEFPDADYIEVGIVRYAESSSPQWSTKVKIDRWGSDRYHLLSADLGFSLNDLTLAWAKGGVDFIFQYDDGFNRTRRGHAGAGVGFHLFATRVTPAAMNIRPVDPVGPNAKSINGMEMGLDLQIPLKRFFTVSSLGGVQSRDSYSSRSEADLPKEDKIGGNSREAGDELFLRFGLIFSVNDPESYMLYPNPDASLLYPYLESSMSFPGSGEDARIHLNFTLSLLY